MMPIPSANYRDGSLQPLTQEQEELKRDLYKNIPVRRRKFIDRIGYDNWDPFPKPNDPMELRTDVTKRTTQQLIREFLQSLPLDHTRGNAYSQGALECALGIVNNDEKYQGIQDFLRWYDQLLKKENHHS